MLTSSRSGVRDVSGRETVILFSSGNSTTMSTESGTDVPLARAGLEWAELVVGRGVAVAFPDFKQRKSCIKSLSKITFAEQTRLERNWNAWIIRVFFPLSN